MTISHPLREKRKMRGTLYALNFLIALQFAITGYFTATFLLSRGVPEYAIGFWYAAASAAGILSLVYTPRLLRAFGNYSVALITAVLFGLGFASYTFAPTLETLFILVIVNTIAGTILYFSLDIFVESSMPSEHDTGLVRGIFLTMANVAYVIGPYIGGVLIDTDNFARLYFFAGALMIPFLALLIPRFYSFRNPSYKRTKIGKTIFEIIHNDDMRNVFIASFILRIFYACMVIYIPLYLRQSFDMSFTDLGLIFSIMLLAFLIFELPMGKLADDVFGEKEIMIIGFAITGIMTIALTEIAHGSVALWALALFITRIGAAMVEITTESYFFKQITGSDTAVLSVFRTLSPLSFIAAPALGILVLFFADFQTLFLLIGLITLGGTLFATQLEDTR